MPGSDGVKMLCPECRWSCVMHSEDELPPGVIQVVEGVPYCPNCRIRMTPVASVVEGTGTPAPGIGEGLSLSDRLAQIRASEREVEHAKRELDDAKDEAAEARKNYDGKVLSLLSLISRLTSVEQPYVPPPLIAAAEQAEADHLADVALVAMLAERSIEVTVERVAAWTPDQRDEVATYLEALKTETHGCDFPAVPGVLFGPIEAASASGRLSPQDDAGEPNGSEMEPEPDPEPARVLPHRRLRRAASSDAPTAATTPA